MRKLLTLLSVCAGFVSYAQSVCGGQSTTLTAANPLNLGSPQYSLNPGGFPPISGTNQFQISPSATTTYTMYTTGTNTANVIVTTSAVVQVTVFPQPVATPTLIQPSCTSSVTGFKLGLGFVPNSTPGYTIVWSSIPNGVLTSQQTSVAAGVLAGPYATTITAAGGCIAYVNFTLLPTPAQPSFSLTPFSSTMVLTCNSPTIDITASNPANTYTWSSNSSAPVISQSVNLNSTNTGSWVVSAQHPTSGCVRSLTFALIQNTLAPTSTVTPLSQVITCTSAIQTVSMTATPTLNIAHYITDPQGGIFTATSFTAIYGPGSVGIYTHVVVNLVNGCQKTTTFSVTSIQGYPTFSLQSPESFTLGCNTRSVATINMTGGSASIPGASISYTLIGPPTSTVYPPGGTLSGNSTYTVNVPGTYTAIVREQPSNCETRSTISVLQLTAPPDLKTTYDYQVLDCDHTVTPVSGSSETPDVSYNWSYLNFNVPLSTINASINPAFTSTIVNNYTLTITNNASTCRITSVVTIYQNLYKPKPQFSLGTFSITCLTPTIVLTNISTSGIPALGTGPIQAPTKPVIGYYWQGPSPQDPLALSSTYVAGINGVYTLTAKDMNNGCVATATQSIDDYRDFPTVAFSATSIPLDCGSAISLRSNGPYKAEEIPKWSSPGPSGSTNSYTLSNVTFPGIYTLTISNSKNGCVASNTIQTTKGIIDAKFAIDRKEGYVPLDVIIFNNSSTSASTVDIKSNWSLGNGTYSTTSQTSVGIKTTYTQPGTYSIGLTVGKFGCIDTAVQYVKVMMRSSLVVPNIFSPNGDGINDVYFLTTTNMSEVTFIIHDRWGHLVYELTSRSGNVLWDGKAQTGAEAAEGVYFYTLVGTGSDGDKYDQKGTITLVR
jgi:gliding motility-associated-like protein